MLKRRKKKEMKSNAKKTGAFWVVLVVVYLIVCACVALFWEDDTENAASAETTSITERTTPSILLKDTTQANDSTEEMLMGSSVSNPYVLNADVWFSEHCTGKTEIKYIDKWVKVSGTVLTISDYSDLKGYYLAGGKGAGLVCWVYSDKLDAQHGEYIEYVGKVTVEDPKHIEISDGEIKNVSIPTNKQKSPITISDWSWSRDYVGGIEWNFRLTNNTDKTVKYFTMVWNCYNAVGDLVYDEITGKSTHGVKYTGPLNPNETTGYLCNSTRFYSHSFNSSKFTLLQVEFTDGTIIQINDKAYTDYYVDKLEAETVIGNNGIKYIVNNSLNTCYIVDIGTCTDTYIGILSSLYGDTVTGIGDFAFANVVFIEKVSISTTLKSIGQGAFSNCTSLAKIEYYGTIEEWNDISKGENWNQNVPATEVICSDGIVPLK